MSILPIGGFMGIAVDVPVTPDHDEGQQWIIEELSKPEYQAAKPTWFDQLSKSFFDWLDSLFSGGADGVQGPLLAILVVVIVIAIVAAFFIFGTPHLNRRSTVAGALFGEEENRDAATLRRAANAAAAGQDWALAIEELFRALARVLTERVLVSTDPGTTAHGFAQRAGTVFPDYALRLVSSATVFDDVRYLGKPGAEPDYVTLVKLERELRTATPTHATPAPLAGVQ